MLRGTPLQEKSHAHPTRPEVLWESTEKRDRGTKWTAYRRCETLEEYILVSQYLPSVEIFSRAGEIWVYRPYGPGESAHLASIDLALPMDLIYEDVEWDQATVG